jgi:hypothetical protein
MYFYIKNVFLYLKLYILFKYIMNCDTCNSFSNNENIDKHNKSKKIHSNKNKKNKDINNYFIKKSSKKHRLDDAIQNDSIKYKNIIIESEKKKKEKKEDSLSYMFEKMNLEMNDFFENDYFF